MVIRYLGYTLVRASRHCIVVSDEAGILLVEAPTWDEAVHWIDRREEEFQRDMDVLTGQCLRNQGKLN
jgi:hypothetical protein